MWYEAVVVKKDGSDTGGICSSKEYAIQYLAKFDLNENKEFILNPWVCKGRKERHFTDKTLAEQICRSARSKLAGHPEAKMEEVKYTFNGAQRVKYVVSWKEDNRNK